jgi:hypothetical protein
MDSITNGGGLGKPDFKDILEWVANIYNQFTEEGSLTLSKRIVSLSTKTIDYITVYTSYYIQGYLSFLFLFLYDYMSFCLS